MFSAPKLAKTKPLVPPSHKDTRYMNSNRKNITNLTNPELCNQSFDTAHALLQKTDGYSKKIPQNDENQHLSTSNKASIGKPFFLMPLPKGTEKQQKVKHMKQKETALVEKISTDDDNVNPMMKNGRNAISLMGKVDFCIKMHKLYPNIDALWDVYGSLYKIIEGKNRFEYILLLRNPSGDGPVLHCIFYDFENILNYFRQSDTLRAVGRFLTEYKLRTFKIEKNLDCKNADEKFSRIQSVTSFALLNNKE